MFQLKTELQVEKTILNTLQKEIEEGDAQELYTAIQTKPAGVVKNMLLSASPFLSDGVLIAYIQNNAPNGHLLQILLANSPLSQSVLDALQQINLPKGIRKLIAAAQNGVSPKKELLKQIDYRSNEVYKIQNDIVRHFLFDDNVTERYKEAIAFIKQENTCLQKKCELIEFYISDKNFSEAQIELLDLATEPDNSDLVKIYDNIIQLEQTVSIEKELTTNATIQNDITEVADVQEKKKAKAIAEVLLKRGKLRANQEDIEALTLGSQGLRLANQVEQLTVGNQSLTATGTIRVFPNPTSGIVNVKHNFNIENGKITFTVYNMLGVEVMNENINSSNTEVKLNNLKAGMYFYSVMQNNQTIKTDKLMVR
ncbi:MAG: T9SS type A sorting domain-containing protein [Flavobacteriales bacterium]|nr:T9SS type A sorting domain-containing protein [Flavobacteriales bacterium]